MILVLDPGLTEEQQQQFCLDLQRKGFFTRLVNQYGQLLLSIDGPDEEHFARSAHKISCVREIIGGRHPYFLASRRFQKTNTIINVGQVDGKTISFGGNNTLIIAGPCAIESEETAVELALRVRKLGCNVFRGMVFKPRSSPYSFQGLGKAGLAILKTVKETTGMLILTEVRDLMEAEMALEFADILQIGTRNMSNYQLLKHLGRLRRPVLLKRGMGSSLEELLCASEYILSHGNPDVILCERGIRTFEQFTRFSLDIGAIPAIKELSHLPVIIDPSHASGKSRLVESLAMAGIAAGADGLMIEVHQNPQNAFSDGTQSIDPDALAQLLGKGQKVAQAIGRQLV